MANHGLPDSDSDYYTLYGEIRSMEMTGLFALPYPDQSLAPLNWKHFTAVCKPVLNASIFCGIRCSDLFPEPPIRIDYQADSRDFPILDVIRKIDIESEKLMAKLTDRLNRHLNHSVSNLSNLSDKSQDSGSYPSPIRHSMSLPFLPSTGSDARDANSTFTGRSFSVQKWSNVSPIRSRSCDRRSCGKNKPRDHSSKNKSSSDRSFQSKVSSSNEKHESIKRKSKSVSLHHSDEVQKEQKRSKKTNKSEMDETFTKPPTPKKSKSLVRLTTSAMTASTPIHAGLSGNEPPPRRILSLSNVILKSRRHQ